MIGVYALVVVYQCHFGNGEDVTGSMPIQASAMLQPSLVLTCGYTAVTSMLTAVRCVVHGHRRKPA